jgi:cytidine deaminase
VSVMSGEELLERADTAAGHAYAPYSNYLVGAAVLAKDGRLFAGGNVENAAYPLGVCAERAVIAKAASEGVRPGEIDAIAITASPCGGCRQWLHEWRIERVYFRRGDGSLAEYAPAGALLPDAWDLPVG